jgi:hypothetical protein
LNQEVSISCGLAAASSSALKREEVHVSLHLRAVDPEVQVAVVGDIEGVGQRAAEVPFLHW